MSDENQLPATVPSKPPAVRKKRERLMTQEEMRRCAQGAGLDEAAAGQWNALTEIGRALAQLGKRNCGTGMTMKSHRFFEQQLEDVEKRLKVCKDDDAIIRLEMIRMELITRMGTLGNNLTTQADKEPKRLAFRAWHELLRPLAKGGFRLTHRSPSCG